MSLKRSNKVRRRSKAEDQPYPMIAPATKDKRELVETPEKQRLRLDEYLQALRDAQQKR